MVDIKRKIGSLALAASLAGIMIGATPVDAQLGADVQRPSAPSYIFTELTVSGPGRGAVVYWGDSRDDVGIDRFRILRNGVPIAIRGASERSVVIPDLPSGSNYMQVEAIDFSGKVSVRTRPAVVYIDRTPPTAPTGLELVEVTTNGASVAFRPSSDNSYVSYRMWVNGRAGERINPYYYNGNLVRISNYALPQGSWSLQVTAEDQQGNVSVRSAPLQVEVGFFDRQRPAAPANPRVKIVGNRYVQLDWDEPYDNVGVSEYSVLITTAGPFGYPYREILGRTAATAYGLPPLPDGSVAWYQITAKDAAGNESVRTIPIRIQYPIVPSPA